MVAASAPTSATLSGHKNDGILFLYCFSSGSHVRFNLRSRWSLDRDNSGFDIVSDDVDGDTSQYSGC